MYLFELSTVSIADLVVEIVISIGKEDFTWEIVTIL